jgi:hypothetical protein
MPLLTYAEPASPPAGSCPTAIYAGRPFNNLALTGLIAVLAAPSKWLVTWVEGDTELTEICDSEQRAKIRAAELGPTAQVKGLWS